MLFAAPAAVGGLDEGADGGPSDVPRSPPITAADSIAGDAVLAGVPVPDGGPDGMLVGGEGCDTPIGGVSVLIGNADGRGGTGGVECLDIDGGGPPAALTALDGGPFGGGGFGVSVAAGAGPFLFTHFFKSLS